MAAGLGLVEKKGKGNVGNLGGNTGRDAVEREEGKPATAKERFKKKGENWVHKAKKGERRRRELMARERGGRWPVSGQ